MFDLILCAIIGIAFTVFMGWMQSMQAIKD